MVGGYDFEKSKFNRATQALRQVGSAFKPIVYAAALETLGYTPATILIDSPLSFPNQWDGSVWSPQNYDGVFQGPIPLRRAVEQSRNIPAVRTLQAVGIEKGIEYARRLGLSSELPPYLPIALGAGEATLAEMTAAFGTFANQGLRMRPFLIDRITDREGNVIEQTLPRATDALRADTAFILTSLLRGVADHGTAARARRLRRPIAGKTGTTNDFTDAWFIGYEPSLAAGRLGGLRREEGLARAARRRRHDRAADLDGVLGGGDVRAADRGVPDPRQRRVRSGRRDGPPGRARAPRACTWRRSSPAPSRTPRKWPRRSPPRPRRTPPVEAQRDRAVVRVARQARAVGDAPGLAVREALPVDRRTAR